MNTQQLLRHWNSKRSLRSRDKVIRLIWPVLKEQVRLFVNDNNQQGEDILIQQFLSHYLKEQTPSDVVEELIAPFDSHFSPYEWRLIVIRRFFIKLMSSNG